MSYLMVRYNAALFLAEDAVFLFLTYKDNLYCLKQVFLRNGFAPFLNRKDRGLIDHIRKIGADST